MKEELIGIQKGATWQNLYDTLWHIATVRYTSADRLKEALPKRVWRRKCATPKKLKALAESGYLNLSDTGVLTCTPKTLRLLKDHTHYNLDLIKLAQGSGEKDGPDNSVILLRLMQHEDFFALFYPEFRLTPKDDQPFLIPDGALVFKKDSKARLVFLEIERPKADWKNHLLKKKNKYELVAGDEKTWSEWWRHWCTALKLEICPLKEFGFTVWCIGSFRADWPGWEFKDE
jgi:hypothetical protein